MMPFSLKDTAETFCMPVEALKLMKKKGLLGDVIEDNQVAWFPLLKDVWGDVDFVRMQMAAFSERERSAVLMESRPNRIDAFILKRYAEDSAKNRIVVDDLVMEIRQKFGVKINTRLVARIKKLRKMAREGMRKVRKNV